MPLLYYWKPEIYRRDLDMGAGYHLNQKNKLLHSVDVGDSLWAFTRNRTGRYVLAAELVVKAKTTNSPSYYYGLYRVWGDLTKSRYFRVDEQSPDIENVLRSFSIKTESSVLGRSFQGGAAVRTIAESEHQLLMVLAKDLPLEPRAGIYPEERLEALLYSENAIAVEKLVKEELSGVAEYRAKILYKQMVTRNRELVKKLQGIYDGKCQLCGWNPMDEYGHWLCHGHHIHWLSRGGEDDIRNLLLVCPNHHGAIHACDAQLDYKDFTFNFGTRVEEVELNLHI